MCDPEDRHGVGVTAEVTVAERLMVPFSPCTPADVDKLAVSGRQGSSLSSGSCSEGTVCSDTSCVHHETLGGLRGPSTDGVDRETGHLPFPRWGGGLSLLLGGSCERSSA